MAISVRAQSATVSADATTTITIAMPAAAQVGDVAVFSYVNSDTGDTITPPSGWSSRQQAGQDFTSHIAWKTLASGDLNPTTHTYTTSAAPSGHAGRIVVFAGATVDDIAGNIASGETGITKVFTFAANYTATTDSWVVILVTNDPSVTDQTCVNDEATMTAQFNEHNVSAAQLTFALWTEAFASSGSGTRSFTATDDQEHAWISFPLATATTHTADLERYLWRNDNGTETSATGAAAENTGITAAVGDTRRLRTLVDFTGDPGPLGFRLQYRRQGDAATEWEDVV